jgi:hypothetical protein
MIKVLSAIASASHDVSPHIKRLSHIQVSPHSCIALQKFCGGSGVGGPAAVDTILYTASAADLTEQTLPISSHDIPIRDLVQQFGLFA